MEVIQMIADSDSAGHVEGCKIILKKTIFKIKISKRFQMKKEQN